MYDDDQGCNHDKGTTNACSSTAINYGWRDPSAGFRSILAYNCATGQCDNMPKAGCPRVQRFSNNVNLYNGKAMGSPQHDNACQINSVKSTIAAYRKIATAQVMLECYKTCPYVVKHLDL